MNTPETSESWRLLLRSRNSLLQVGQYDFAISAVTNNIQNGLSLSRNGRGCNSSIGEFTIFEIEYDGDELRKLTADFTQYCEEQISSALRGSIRFDASFTNQ